MEKRLVINVLRKIKVLTSARFETLPTFEKRVNSLELTLFFFQQFAKKWHFFLLLVFNLKILIMKRLIICSDGTWNSPDQEDRGKRKPSNVVKMVRAILPIDVNGIHQIVYYDAGVGTDRGLNKLLGGAFGAGLFKNIIDCYRFIVHNYNPGDELYFFGFSRGAYTVRSLAGFIQCIGVLPKSRAFFIPEGFQLYRNGAANSKKAEDFIKGHASRMVEVKFMGVWDTVGALGIPIGGPIGSKLNKKHGFHNVELGKIVKNAFHALAIDERRKPFRPAIWKINSEYKQKVEQVWFVGVHTNIGGGYEKDGLANIPFQWIKEKAEACDLALNNKFTKFYKPWFKDELRDSMTWGYRAFGKHIRKLCVGENSFESVHESAIQRFLTKNPPKDGVYKPSNLREYIEKNIAE